MTERKLVLTVSGQSGKSYEKQHWHVLGRVHLVPRFINLIWQTCVTRMNVWWTSRAYTGLVCPHTTKKTTGTWCVVTWYMLVLLESQKFSTTCSKHTKKLLVDLPWPNTGEYMLLLNSCLCFCLTLKLCTQRQLTMLTLFSGAGTHIHILLMMYNVQGSYMFVAMAISRTVSLLPCGSIPCRSSQPD